MKTSAFQCEPIRADSTPAAFQGTCANEGLYVRLGSLQLIRPFGGCHRTPPEIHYSAPVIDLMGAWQSGGLLFYWSYCKLNSRQFLHLVKNTFKNVVFACNGGMYRKNEITKLSLYVVYSHLLYMLLDVARIQS